MNAEELLTEIQAVFPSVEMPIASELAFHREGCVQCTYLARDMEDYRGKPIGGEAIRYLHQELSCLSANGWRWVLRHYLSFCLTPEAEYNMMETEFLIYNLGPDKQFKKGTLERLSGLNGEQLSCLIHFMERLEAHPRWSEYCPIEIRKSLEFFRAINA